MEYSIYTRVNGSSIIGTYLYECISLECACSVVNVVDISRRIIVVIITIIIILLTYVECVHDIMIILKWVYNTSIILCV